jgi:hypothetical protein
MQSLETFCWAASAFVVGEAVACYLSLRQIGCMPKCWSSPIYWAVVVVVALGAGGFAVAMEMETKKHAFFAGLACPFIIHRFLSEQGTPTHRGRRRDS